MSTIEIRFNGEARSVASENVAGLLLELGLEKKLIAVELNREIVPRANYPQATIKNGDVVEVVQFVGGG